MSTTRKLLWLRHASADQARQLQAAVPSMDLEKASKSWLPRPSPGRTAATVITFDGLSRRNGITVFPDKYPPARWFRLDGPALKKTKTRARAAPRARGGVKRDGHFH